MSESDFFEAIIRAIKRERLIHVESYDDIKMINISKNVNKLTIRIDDVKKLIHEKSFVITDKDITFVGNTIQDMICTLEFNPGIPKYFNFAEGVFLFIFKPYYENKIFISEYILNKLLVIVSYYNLGVITLKSDGIINKRTDAQIMQLYILIEDIKSCITTNNLPNTNVDWSIFMN